MQAALFIREKQELRKKKLKIRRGRYELPSHVATKDIAPFPRFPPNSWGKAAWQDRELGFDVDRRESVCVTSEAAATHRFKQKEAHKRWVKRNRIHDSTFGDCSSEDEDIYNAYGVQSTAANALLYIGLGTMCIGMIIAFVGTGEKGFKTIELRLIGPSLIGAGVMIIIFRVMLCVCPSKCLKFNKHKHKNSTNKLNSEDEGEDNAWKDQTECAKDGKGLPKQQTTKSDSKKRVSIVEMPTTSTASAGNAGEEVQLIPAKERKQVRESLEKPSDVSSINSDVSVPSHHTRLSWTEGGEPSGMKDSSNQSDVSLNSLANGFFNNSDSFDSEISSKTVKNASKYESHRSPKNQKNEIVLNPSNLNELHESD
ncbi:UNVERIFIED_CONTAM: hypothetical protein PYX00_000417 [Menopon gallinae]|uniref:Uncharacterized protein n=1 Tax=Menopon gallinae TaxID=328185 RepID=A0AAW2IA76_9NEOP